jgi:hypothetical protein
MNCPAARANVGAMSFRALILWVHVLCGVIWVGACATFILAAALSGEPDSLRLIMRAAAQINRLCVPLAIAIPVTGIGNLFFAAQARGSVLPAEFLGIVAAKVGLLAIMVAGLSAAWRAAPMVKEQPATPASDSTDIDTLRRIITLYGLIVGAGIAALGLGLWLAGT